MLLAALAVASSPLHAEMAVKSGDTIAFMGDSITEGGNRPGGYVTLYLARGTFKRPH